MMSRYFILNDKKSSDFNVALPKEFSFESSSPTVDFIKIPGLDGELAVNNKSLSNVKRKLTCGVINRNKESYHSIHEKLSDWLSIDGWTDFFYSDDELYTYKVLISDSFNLERIQKNFLKLEIELTFKPVKYLKSELNPKIITSGTIIKNTKNLDAKPLIEIEGQGDVTLTINNQKITVKSLDKHIALDCQSQTARQGSQNVSKKVYANSYPVLKKGENKISWTGNVTKCTVTTRLGARI
ncbi:phage tail domain-containing protein [Vagococcus fessus]|uniref:Siphovirus-type tail component RIFT-related domain-containing protein n=1 Tax=Vagococcus fessus TaxID=120370 RepID=A0A430A5A2_9ENTE|nr:phage tail domain-containing protein [Vagococcus fessus]RSU01969.1 hypothetical protein CBF31_09385 [Vagococcus fessus]